MVITNGTSEFTCVDIQTTILGIAKGDAVRLQENKIHWTPANPQGSPVDTHPIPILSKPYHPDNSNNLGWAIRRAGGMVKMDGSRYDECRPLVVVFTTLNRLVQYQQYYPTLQRDGEPFVVTPDTLQQFCDAERAYIALNPSATNGKTQISHKASELTGKLGEPMATNDTWTVRHVNEQHAIITVNGENAMDIDLLPALHYLTKDQREALIYELTWYTQLFCAEMRK